VFFELIYGVIKANGGDTPRVASEITYTIEAELPSVGRVELPSQTPGQQRRQGIEVQPYPVGALVLGVLLENRRTYWMFREIEAYGDCPAGGGAAFNMLPEELRMMLENQARGVTVQTAPTGGGPSEGGGGGGGGGEA